MNDGLKYFSHDSYKFESQTKDSVEIKNKKDGPTESVERKKKDNLGAKKMNDPKGKKFAMMVVSNNNKDGNKQGYSKPNRSNENPPTYANRFSSDPSYKF